MPRGACAGIRVLDLTQGLGGPLATMILADYGAEVVRVEPPGGDLGWNDPAYLLLQRGKKSIAPDLSTPAGRADLHKVVEGIDVVVENVGPARAEQYGVTYDALSAANPNVVVCSITAFGPESPWPDMRPEDGLVMAKSGIYRDQPGWDQDRKRPIYRASREAEFFTAMLTVQGVLGALMARDITGKAQHVEINLHQALTCRQNARVRWLLREGEELPPDTAVEGGPVRDDTKVLAHHRDPREVTLTSMLVACKDDRFLIHSLTEPHFFPAWIKAIDFEWIWSDERFKGAPHRIADPADKAELIELIRARLKERTAQEWMDVYVATGNVCAAVVQTTQEALRHPQVVESGYVVEVDDPRVGPILQLGALAMIPGAPASVQVPAPLPGEHTEEVLAEQVAPTTLPAPTRDALVGPLDGVTIVEAATYYATPFGSALMSDLGARVIKVEPLSGDLYRKLASVEPGQDPVLHLGQNNMVRAVSGKESISINLKDERGRKILYELVSKADVFVHNYRPGVPERLGLDEPTLRKLNPGMLYQYGAAWGSTGPYASQPAIDPVVGAFAGQTEYQAGEGNPPLAETGADPIAAAGTAAAMMLGLFARHRTGKGQYVESVMILSNLYANAEDGLSYEGKAPRPAVDHLQYGTGATYRLYETAPVGPDFGPVDPSQNPTPHWVFLSVRQDDEFSLFCKVAGREDIANDARFSTVEARVEHRRELEAVLEPVFMTRTAPEWESACSDVEVGCVLADEMSHFAFLYSDAIRALGIMEKAEHPTLGGTYWRASPLINFSETPGRVLPFFENGEHTRSILEELGYDRAEVDDLEQAGVVASWTPPEQ